MNQVEAFRKEETEKRKRIEAIADDVVKVLKDNSLMVGELDKVIKTVVIKVNTNTPI